ncbi:MAG: hypothetical protein J6V15_00160, partial [Clostridia bacterium]|nr:hypothetical protein [Clostridia bacterium]
LLAREGICADMILCHGHRMGLTVGADKIKATLGVLLANTDTLSLTSVISDGNVAKLSLVGCGLCSDASVGARMLAALTERGIAVRSMVAAEIKISVLIPLSSAQEASEAVHREFFGQ